MPAVEHRRPLCQTKKAVYDRARRAKLRQTLQTPGGGSGPRRFFRREATKRPELKGMPNRVAEEARLYKLAMEDPVERDRLQRAGRWETMIYRRFGRSLKRPLQESSSDLALCLFEEKHGALVSMFLWVGR